MNAVKLHRKTNDLDRAREATQLLIKEIDQVKKASQDAQLRMVALDVAPLKGIGYLRPYQSLRGHHTKVADVRWSADSKTLLSAAQDGYLIIWDAVTALKINAVPLASPWVLACAYAPDTRLVASGGLDNACTVYRVAGGFGEDSSPMGGMSQRVVLVLKGHTAYISDCQFLDPTRIVTASGDMTCALWDVTRARRVREFVDHLGDVLCLEPLTANTFASGASDGYVRLWDTRQQIPVQSHFVGHTDINCMRVFPGGNSLALGTEDGVIRMFDMRADCELASYTAPRSRGRALRVPRHQQPTVSTQPQYTMQPGDPFQALQTSASLRMGLESGTSLSSEGTSAGVTSLDFSRSGRLLYGCFSDQGCVVFDTLRANVVGQLEGHLNRVNLVRCSPDGIAVCTASWDSTMKVWSLS